MVFAEELAVVLADVVGLVLDNTHTDTARIPVEIETPAMPDTSYRLLLTLYDTNLAQANIPLDQP